MYFFIYFFAALIDTLINQMPKVALDVKFIVLFRKHTASSCIKPETFPLQKKKSLIIWPHRLHTLTPSNLSATTHSVGKNLVSSAAVWSPQNANWKLRCTSLICCSNPAPKKGGKKKEKRKEKSVGRATLIIHKKKNYKRGPGLWRYWALNVTRSLWSSRLPLSLTSPLHETRCSRQTQPATVRDIST